MIFSKRDKKRQKETWQWNAKVHRLQVGTPQYEFLTDALDRVLVQPIGVAKGNHANLILAMSEIFNKVQLTKDEAVCGAIWALWREHDIFHSHDPYVMEFVMARDAEKEHDDYYAHLAELARSE